MRRTIITLGLATALVLVAALPASAAPHNARNDFEIPVTCVDAEGDELPAWTAVRPTPSPVALPAWDVETGQLQLGKNFNFTVTLTATVVSGPEVSMVVFEDETDHGSQRGNKDLITCTAVFFDGVVDRLENITAEQAAELNADFGTDIFAAGQEVEISVAEVLTVLAVVPGRRG